MRVVREWQQWLADRAYASWHDLLCDLPSMARDKNERQFIRDMRLLTLHDVNAVPNPEQQARLRDIYEAAHHRCTCPNCQLRRRQHRRRGAG
jgi:hypothetical protein